MGVLQHFHFFRAAMQINGNFVLYNSNNLPQWASGTEANPRSKLVFGDSCDLKVVSESGFELWTSKNTCGKGLGKLTSHISTTPHQFPLPGQKSAKWALFGNLS
jgi:hypothetical protein